MIPNKDLIPTKPNEYIVTDLGGGRQRIVPDFAPIENGTDVNKVKFDEILAFSGVTSGDNNKFTLTQEGYLPFDGATGRVKLHKDMNPGATLSINGGPEIPIITIAGRKVKAFSGSWITITYNTSSFILQGEGGGSGERYGNGVGQISTFELLMLRKFNPFYGR